MIRMPFLNDKNRFSSIVPELYKEYKSGKTEEEIIQDNSHQYQEEEVSKVLTTFPNLPVSLTDNKFYNYLKTCLWLFLVLSVWPAFFSALDIVLILKNLWAFALIPISFLLPIISLILLIRKSENAFSTIGTLWFILLAWSGSSYLDEGMFSFSNQIETINSVINLFILLLKVAIPVLAFKLEKIYPAFVLKVDNLLRDGVRP